MSLHFVAVVTILNDFGAQENKICHCFHFLPIYMWDCSPWGGKESDMTKQLHTQEMKGLALAKYEHILGLPHQS